MTNALVIAEHHGGELAPPTLNVIGAARQLSAGDVDVAVLARAGGGKRVAAAAAAVAGVGRVLLLERPENSPYLAAIWAPQVAELARRYTHVLAPATTFGKDLIPRAAALCDVGAISDIVAIEAPYRIRRPVFAGNAILGIEADSTRTVFATVRATAFAAPATQAAATIEPTRIEAALPGHTRLLARHDERSSGPDLQTASTVVAGGRGLGGEEGVRLIGQLAACLGAAVGASRAAVDSGWMSNDLQIGQTGKIIAPDLYIGVGISGAIQHMTGIRDAGIVVAINNDPDAPICGAADIVLVGDLFSALPALTERLAARKAG